MKEGSKDLNVRELIAHNKSSKSMNTFIEKVIPKGLLLIAIISILTTIGIVFTLLFETFEFFKRVPFLDFFTGTVLKPLGDNAEFGVLPLLTGTIISSTIA